MSGFRVDPILLKLNEVRRGEITLVAIDGRGGSGKTILATELKRKTDAQIVHGDDFYQVMDETERIHLSPEAGYERYFDWRRLKEQVLDPLEARQAPRYQKYDWIHDELGEWSEVRPKGLIIIEGVYTARPELRPYYDFSILVNTPREECLRRLRERGGNSEKWVLRWAAAEDYYFRTVMNKSDFDYLIGTGA